METYATVHRMKVQIIGVILEYPRSTHQTSLDPRQMAGGQAGGSGYLRLAQSGRLPCLPQAPSQFNELVFMLSIIGSHPCDGFDRYVWPIEIETEEQARQGCGTRSSSTLFDTNERFTGDLNVGSDLFLCKTPQFATPPYHGTNVYSNGDKLPWQHDFMRNGMASHREMIIECDVRAYSGIVFLEAGDGETISRPARGRRPTSSRRSRSRRGAADRLARAPRCRATSFEIGG